LEARVEWQCNQEFVQNEAFNDKVRPGSRVDQALIEAKKTGGAPFAGDRSNFAVSEFAQFCHKLGS